MKEIIKQLLQQAVERLKQDKIIAEALVVDIKIERAKEGIHGDYASNIALLLAKPCQLPPRQIAEKLIKALPEQENLAKVEIAGPGFINFFLHQQALFPVIGQILHHKERFGRCDVGQGQKVLLEYVSSNPTGPLHVGHGRGAAFGATLANLLDTAGFAVTREYYVNDAGRQMAILAVSVWLRYLMLLGEAVIFPENAYKGAYVKDIAASIVQLHQQDFFCAWTVVAENLPLDEPQGGDKELYIDAIIARAKNLLGDAGFAAIYKVALDSVLQDIQQDLSEFGVEFDNWFSEASLFKSGAIDKSLQALSDRECTYRHKEAVWFKAESFGDEKDRVLVRSNGQTTYFASDVAYHWNKYDRGYDRVIDIFGADHHGYVPRVKAAVHALGHDDTALTILFVQFAILYRGETRVQMSTRSGSFVTLRALREEVGNDAARFFYVMRKPEQHMDFDLELAKSQSNDNPVYYIQYAHARICSVFRQLAARGFTWNESLGLQSTQHLVAPQEVNLINLLSQYPELIASAASTCEPHHIAYYLRELANALHTYYNAIVLLCEPEDLRNARMCLLAATQQVIKNGLQILGVSAPESM